MNGSNEPQGPGDDMPNVRGWLRALDTMVGGATTGLGCLMIGWILLVIPGVILTFLLYLFGIWN